MAGTHIDFNQNARRLLDNVNYDQIRILGESVGRGPGSHFVGAIIYRETEKTVELLVVPYRSGSHIGKTFTDEPAPCVPEETLHALLAKQGLSIRKTVDVAEMLIQSAYVQLTDGHEKFFYLISESDLIGDIIAMKDAADSTGIPFWAPLEQVETVLHYAHRKPLSWGLEIIKQKSMPLYEKVIGKFRA
jgi:hypothetical protein